MIKLIIITLMFLPSCSSAIVLRDFSKRIYYPCEQWQTAQPVGKFCYHYCTKWKLWHEHISENCTEWASDVQDLSDEETFKKFKMSGFKLGV